LRGDVIKPARDPIALAAGLFEVALEFAGIPIIATSYISQCFQALRTCELAQTEECFYARVAMRGTLFPRSGAGDESEIVA